MDFCGDFLLFYVISQEEGTRSPGFPIEKENRGKTKEHNRKTKKIDLKLPQKCLKISPYTPLDSLKGTPRSQDPWVSNWKATLCTVEEGGGITWGEKGVQAAGLPSTAEIEIRSFRRNRK